MMNYEAWRISFQDSEQAARVAFNNWQADHKSQKNELADMHESFDSMYEIAMERAARIAALESQLAESRADAMRFFMMVALFDHIAVNEWLVQGCAKGQWFRVYFKQPPQGVAELADGPLDALRAVVDQARSALAAEKE